jgi:S1-C subfamily serine protease
MVVKVTCPIIGPGAEDTPISELPAQTGSGVLLVSDGIVITNSHVIPQFKDQICYVTFPEEGTGRIKWTYAAKAYVIKDISEYYDLAFLEIVAPISKDAPFPTIFTSIGDEGVKTCLENDIKLNDPVRILGYPEITGGLSLTITDGIVSSKPGDGYIFTSAKINEGNSGGMALGKDDCFIGIPAMVNKGDMESMGVIISNDTIGQFLNSVLEIIKTDEDLEANLIQNVPANKAFIRTLASVGGSMVRDVNDIFYIKGETSSNCEKIIVTFIDTEGKESDAYQLTKYKYGDTSFRYGIREDFGNIGLGDNTYVFTAYCDGDQIVRTSIDFNFDMDLSKILQIFQGDLDKVKPILEKFIGMEPGYACPLINDYKKTREHNFWQFEDSVRALKEGYAISKFYIPKIQKSLNILQSFIDDFRKSCHEMGYEI